MVTVRLAAPMSDNAYVLHCLLNRPFLSERDLKLNGFRARISNLRLMYGVPVKFKLTPFITKFGKKRTYRNHFISKSDEALAVSVYNKINHQ